MKTSIFTVLTFTLILNQLHANLTAEASAKVGLSAFSRLYFAPADRAWEPAFAEAGELSLDEAGLPAFAEAGELSLDEAGLPAFAEATAGKGGDPTDIKVVVSQKRIWLIADEMPMKCLKTQIKNAEGKIVLEKCFSSKCADWFLNIEALPKGEYTLFLGSDHVEKFRK